MRIVLQVKLEDEIHVGNNVVGKEKRVNSINLMVPAWRIERRGDISEDESILVSWDLLDVL